MLANWPDKILDYFSDKMWSNWKSLSIKRKILTLIFLGCLLFIATFHAEIKETVSLVRYIEIPWSTTGKIFSSDNLIQIKNIQNRIAARLIHEGKILVGSSGLKDTWTFAQIIVGLGKRNINKMIGDDHQKLILDRVQVDRSCWCQYQDEIQPCHLGTTGWVLLSHAYLNKAPPLGSLEFVINQQHSSGWWALYEDANNYPKNASTYSTALIIIALQSLVEENLVSNEKLQPVKKSIKIAANWLSKWVSSDSYLWKDYPKREFHGKEMKSLTGMAIYALKRLQHPVSEAISNKCLKKLVENAVTVSDQEVSLMAVRLNNGSYRTDYVRHNILVWSGIAISACYDKASFSNKARARRFIDKSLLGANNTPDLEMQFAWEVGELSLLVNELTGGK
jgi:hypothetical protein